MNKYNLEEIEKRKNNALMFRNPVEYFKACNELGIEPEIKDLYELGQVEIGFKLSNLEKSVKQKIKIKRKRSTPDNTYKKFYQDSSRLSLNIGETLDKKRELLIKYFPRRFGDEGRTPVYNMNCFSIGKLFIKIIEYSKERINQ